MRDPITRVLTMPTTQLGRATRFLVSQVRLWIHCARLLRQNRAGQKAAALAYHTIFGLLPTAIVMLMIFQALPAYRGVGQRVQHFIYDQLQLTSIRLPAEAIEPDAAGASAAPATEEPRMLTDYLDDLVTKFFSGVDKGSITLLGAVLVIWAALALLVNAERIFNEIWHVGRGRSFINKIINYWALLTLGPLLLGVGIHLSGLTGAWGPLRERVPVVFHPLLMGYGVALLGFFLMVYVLPNTRVEPWAALWGAAVAALVWTGAKWGFRQYVTWVIPYSTVYGIIGLIPLAVLWIHVSWMIVLFGLQLAFTTQHLGRLSAAELARTREGQDCFLANDVTVLHVLRTVARDFENRQGPVSAESICSRLGIPAAFGERLLGFLVEAGLLARTSEPRVGYLPGRDPETVTLAEVSHVVARASFSQAAERDDLVRLIDRHRLGQTELNLKDLLKDPVEPVGSEPVTRP